MATFHQISSQNLECPICLTLFSQPKLLACSHTFCKDCLEHVFQAQPNPQTITCPVCRQGTPISSGDVSKLQTNVPLNSLVNEVKTKSPICTVCEMDEKPPAVSYCQDCGKYMCKSCEISHSNWKPVSNHEVVPMSEVLAGKIPLKRRRKCKRHPSDDEECFCIECQEYVCCKCGMLRHLQAGHQIEEATIHEEKLMENIRELRERATSKKAIIENRIDFIQIQRNEITFIMRRLNDDIDETYEECMQLLSARREAMKCQVKQWSENFEKELQVMEEESHQTICHINAMEELVTNGVKVPLEKDALFTHDTLCENLKSFLGQDYPGNQSPECVTEQAQRILFNKPVKFNELCLGELKDYKWYAKADVVLPSENSMNCITCAPDGKMSVGSFDGGIHLYSPDGEFQQTVLKDGRIYGVAFLADGRSVLRYANNTVSLYTQHWEELDVTFETMSSDEGGYGGLTVDRNDNIYVGYKKTQNIQVFTPQSCKAVREIICDRCTPYQLFPFNTMGSLILKDSSAVVCLDGNGEKENVLKKGGMSPYPAVCEDDSVIVAWVKHKEGLVSIDRYTSDLEHTHNVITDFVIQKPKKRAWYYLQELESGEIAFCTPDRMYIFDAIYM